MATLVTIRLQTEVALQDLAVLITDSSQMDTTAADYLTEHQIDRAVLNELGQVSA